MVPTSVLTKAFPRARGYNDARPPATLVATGGLGLGGEWQSRADPVRCSSSPGPSPSSSLFCLSALFRNAYLQKCYQGRDNHRKNKNAKSFCFFSNLVFTIVSMRLFEVVAAVMLGLGEGQGRRSTCAQSRKRRRRLSRARQGAGAAGAKHQQTEMRNK